VNELLHTVGTSAPGLLLPRRRVDSKTPPIHCSLQQGQVIVAKVYRFILIDNLVQAWVRANHLRFAGCGVDKWVDPAAHMRTTFSTCLPTVMHTRVSTIYPYAGWTTDVVGVWFRLPAANMYFTRGRDTGLPLDALATLILTHLSVLETANRYRAMDLSYLLVGTSTNCR